jgi:elongation factor G
MAIEPENTTERKKLSEVLDMLQRQDPTLKASENSESGQTLISGMGELHLDVIKHRLTRDFNLNVKFYKPRVSYRETIGKSIEVTGKCQRQIGSQQMFAEVKLRIEPLPNPSSPVVVFDLAAGDATLPDNYRLAAMEELRHRGQGGGMIGSFPLTGIKISLLGGTCSVEGSDEVAFRIAANDGFEKGMEAAGPVLLEPVMRLEITTPDDYMGEIVGDLQQRRAMIERTEARGTLTVVTATAPLKELFGYSTAIRSLSQGRAGCSMEPSGYQAAPAGDAEAYSF